ncbi:hypothetical protein ACFVMC_11620 [Nocardia sp. NPDC127579]|uniref:hypothetical protein n=1 Tax=Nocardia sp. NPDC127579 TaxID=3345402 RepID=UPI003628E8BC
MRVRAFVVAGALASALTMAISGVAAAQPADTMPEDGLYLVGVDIVPGTYEAPGTPDPAFGCDYRRLWKVEGDNTDQLNIIGNDFTRVHPVRVLIKPTDVAFKTTNCGPWRLVPAISTGSFGG